MAAGNTSAFNCRWVVNNPGVRSPHSYGPRPRRQHLGEPLPLGHRAGPQLLVGLALPPARRLAHALHGVVQIMLDAGFSWTYGTGDSQHFDVTGGAASAASAGPPMCNGYPATARPAPTVIEPPGARCAPGESSPRNRSVDPSLRRLNSR